MSRYSIQLRSGLYFDMLEPDPSVIRINDIAHALSMLCRFTGHCSRFYSVAQHSMLVASILIDSGREDLALWGLLHDAPETYLGDVARPLKMLLPDYQMIERRVEHVVFGALGLVGEIPEEVKRADMVALATEKKYIMPEGHWPGLDGIEPAPFIGSISSARPEYIESLFLSAYGTFQLGKTNGEWNRRS